MMRWWWFGPAVTEPELEREMRLMKEGGIGGFEVQRSIRSCWMTRLAVSRIYRSCLMNSSPPCASLPKPRASWGFGLI